MRKSYLLFLFIFLILFGFFQIADLFMYSLTELTNQMPRQLVSEKQEPQFLSFEVPYLLE